MLIGKNVRRYVETLLLKDLVYHGIDDISGLHIDWKAAVGEGGGVAYRDEYIEGASDVLVKNRRGEKVLCGWTDYIVDRNGKLYSYWTMLDELTGRKDYNFSKFERNGFGIPEHIWSILSEEDRRYLAETRQGWHSDINLLPYRIAVIPDLIRNKISEYKSVDIDGLKKLNSDINIDFLVSEMERYMFYSEKILRKEETRASELLTYTFEAYGQVMDFEKNGGEDGKKIKQLYEIINTFYLITTHAELIYRIAKDKGLMS